MYHNVLFTKLVSLVDYQILRCIGQAIRSLVFDPTMPSVTITVKMGRELFLRRTSSLCTSHCASLLLTHLYKNFLVYYRLGITHCPQRPKVLLKILRFVHHQYTFQEFRAKADVPGSPWKITTVCNKSCKIHPIRSKKGSLGVSPCRNWDKVRSADAGKTNQSTSLDWSKGVPINNLVECSPN